jgi:hypothetical protein
MVRKLCGKRLLEVKSQRERETERRRGGGDIKTNFMEIGCDEVGYYLLTILCNGSSAISDVKLSGIITTKLVN